MTTLHQRGLFPGIAEDEDSFFSRIALLEHSSPPPFFKKSERVPQEVLEKIYTITEPLFAIRPDWITAFYSCEKLPFWEAAASWEIDDSPPLIQLHPSLKKGPLLKLYSQEEILAHEAIHAVRYHLKQHRFEEILAYRTSSSPFRRYWGPIFQKPWESLLFVLLLPLALLNLYLELLPLLFLTYLAIRLILLQRTFTKCLRNLTFSTQPLAIALRLTDEEIDHFAHSTPDEILQYLQQGSPRLKPACQTL